MARNLWPCLVLVFVALLPLATGISIRPGIVKMNLVPGFERTFDYWVGNTLDEPIDVDVHLFTMSDALQNSLTASTDHLELGPREMKKFEVTLKIPPDVIAPGINHLQVAVYEQKRKNSPSGINVKAAVASTFEIRGLYPGKYAEATLDISGDVTKQVQFNLGISNFGTEIIRQTAAKFEVYNVMDNSFVTQVDGANKLENLEPWKSDTITATLDTSTIKSGQYKVVGTVFYDANVTKTDAFFRIGQYNLQILGFPDSGTAGQIMDFPIKIKSDWNQAFNDVYASVAIKKNGEVVKSFETTKTILAPFEAKTITGYLDLRDTDIGEYDVEVRVYFSEGVIVQSGPFKIHDEAGNTFKEEQARKGGMIAQKPKKPFWTTTNILIIIIIFLILLNALWFMKYLRNREAY